MISMTMSVQFVVSDDWCHLNQSYSSVLFEEELKEMYEWSVFGTQRLVPGSRRMRHTHVSSSCGLLPVFKVGSLRLTTAATNHKMSNSYFRWCVTDIVPLIKIRLRRLLVVSHSMPFMEWTMEDTSACED